MLTLQYYLFREWLLAFAGVSVVLFLVVVGIYAGDMLGDVADGALPAGLLAGQLFYRMPEALQLILPLALFIGIMLGLGRFYRDQEMAVMRSCGFSWVLMLRPLAALVIPLSLMLLMLTFWMGPKSVSLATAQLDRAYESAVVWGLKPGQFHTLQNGDLVIYVESMNETGDQFNNVFIYQNINEREQVWTAASGRYWLEPGTTNRFLSLENGEVNEHAGEALAQRVSRFERADLKLPPLRNRHEDGDVTGLTLPELLARDDASASAEFHWRISPALALPLLGLLAIPLAHTEPRDSRFGRLMTGLLVYAVYANLLTLGKVWVEDGVLPESSGLWWVHLGLLLLGLLWLRQQGRALRL